MKRLAIVALAALGCGDGAETVGLAGTGGAALGGMSGGAGGAGGATPSGYGEITAADALMCEDWPLCPEGVYAFREGATGVMAGFSDRSNPICGARGVWVLDGSNNGEGIACMPGTAADPTLAYAAGSACLLPCKNTAEAAASCTRRTCGECVDFRATTCVQFVARCRAPVVQLPVCGRAPLGGAPSPEWLAKFQASGGGPVGFFRQCTGNDDGPGSLARVACGG